MWKGVGLGFWQNPGMDAPGRAGQAGMETAPLGQIYMTGWGQGYDSKQRTVERAPLCPQKVWLDPLGSEGPLKFLRTFKKGSQK